MCILYRDLYKSLGNVAYAFLDLVVTKQIHFA